MVVCCLSSRVDGRKKRPADNLIMGALRLEGSNDLLEWTSGVTCIVLSRVPICSTPQFKPCLVLGAWCLVLGAWCLGQSMKNILSRYEKSCLEEEGSDKDIVSIKTSKFQTCKELLQKVDRLVEETNTEELSVSVADMTQLEEELNAALVQTRSRKTQLMMEYVSTLQQQEKTLSNENEEREKQIAASEHIFAGGDDGGGGLNDPANNHMDSPPHLTLRLFNG
ncbi:hypothetical protein L1887_33037 [Cichorium endivia]|nr:hypothetical protein L1887_33037 [Cichorium endivia]